MKYYRCVLTTCSVLAALMLGLAGCASGGSGGVGSAVAGAVLPSKPGQSQVLKPDKEYEGFLNQPPALVGAGESASQEEALLKAVVRAAPNDVDTWYRLGNLYAKHDRAEEAAIAYQRTLLLDNAHTRAWHNLSVMRMRQAYASLVQAQLSVDPKDPMAKRIELLLQEMNRLTILDTGAPSKPAALPAAQTASQAQPKQ